MIHIWTDGAADPVTRNGGWAAAFKPQDIHISGSVVDTTNVRMEYTAIIAALEYIYNYASPEEHITVHTDSETIVRQQSGEYSVKRNLDLYNKLKSWIESETSPHVKLEWEPRNSTPELKWADKEAKYRKELLDTRPTKKLKF